MKSKKLKKFYAFPSSQKISQKELIKKDAFAPILEKASQLIKHSNFKTALSYLNKVLKEDPSNPQALYSRGKCYISLELFKEAIPDLLSLIQDYPSYEKNAYIALAMSFVGLNDYKTAIRQLSKGLSKFPKFKDAYLARGQLLAHQKIWDKAISDFYKVISTVPEDGKAYVSLAEALKSMGDIPNALRVLSSVAIAKIL